MSSGYIEINFNEISREFLLENNGKTLAIEKENEVFFIRLKLKKYNNKLVIFSNGAVDTSKKEPPVFMRETWHDKFDASCIFIDDKTIHDKNLAIGWGIGTEDRHYLNDYVEIVKKVSENIYVLDENIFYYGSSAGGFMSIAMASMHRGTVAIANNPQAYVYNYFTSSVNRLYEEIFTEKDPNIIKSKYSTRLSLTAIFKSTRNIPKTFYMQNRLCKMDMNQQLYPFWKTIEKLGIKSNKINFILYNNEISQHNPLNKNETIETVNGILNNTLKILV